MYLWDNEESYSNRRFEFNFYPTAAKMTKKEGEREVQQAVNANVLVLNTPLGRQKHTF